MTKINELLQQLEVFISLAQMKSEAPDQWKFEVILFKAGLFPRDQAGITSPAFERMWISLLTKLVFESDYSVSFIIPANTFNVLFKVTSKDPNTKQLENELNSKLAPKMTKVMQAMNGKTIPGTKELFGPSKKTHTILLAAT